MSEYEKLIASLNRVREGLPETRSRRVQVLVTPTMHEALKELSASTGVSVNEIINVALSNYLGEKC